MLIIFFQYCWKARNGNDDYADSYIEFLQWTKVKLSDWNQFLRPQVDFVVTQWRSHWFSVTNC